MNAREQIELVNNLKQTLEAACGSGQVRLFETHISFVILTGTFAYKIKKAVALDFLDFSTLEKRHFYCLEELRLNQRFSGDLYLEVLPIAGTIGNPHIGAPGAPIEYAVKMREFPQACLADNLVRKGALLPSHAISMAQRLAESHKSAARLDPACEYGSSAMLSRKMAATFEGLRLLLDGENDLRDVSWLSDWCARELAAKSPVIEQRRNGGFVRECHGDLHLGNIALLDGQAALFDCIEFDDALRCIDVMSDMAFVAMDLHAHGRRDLCYLFLNTYLELTGDHDGVAVLRLYLVQRALIRCHVALLRRRQAARNGAGDDAGEAPDYLHLAMTWAQPTYPFLLLMHGLSGCGKTRVSDALKQTLAALRIRSDVERKRLPQQIAAAESPSSGVQSLYDAAHTKVTYGRLLQLAQSLLEEGYNVIVDACSLLVQQRRPFMALAASLDAPFAILDVCADEHLLRARIMRRAAEAVDASEADVGVLEHQILAQENFEPDEGACVVAYESRNGNVIDKKDPAYDTLERRLMPQADAASTTSSWNLPLTLD